MLLQSWRQWLVEHNIPATETALPENEHLSAFLESRFKKESDRRLNRFIILTYYTHFPDGVTHIGALKQTAASDADTADIVTQLRDMENKAEQRHHELVQLLTKHHEESLAVLRCR